MMISKPSFWVTLKSIFRLSTERRWFVAYVPWLFILSVGVPVLLTNQSNLNFNENLDKNGVITILSAFLVVAGILAAACIAAMTQILQICGTWPFSSYLEDQKLFDEFILMPQLIFKIQLFCVFVFSFSIIFCNLTEKFDLLLSFNFGILCYLIFKTIGLLNLIRTITWHYAKYMKIYNETKD